MSRASTESLKAYLEYLKQKYFVPLESLAKGAQQSVSYMDYKSMISAVTVLAKGHYSIGQNVLIVTLNVPDLWVSGILDEFTPCVYVSDEQFVLELNTNGYVNIGYYRLSALETGKVNLPEYVKYTDYATSTRAGVVKGDKTFGFQVNTNGIPTCDILSASEYTDKTVACFISKGTLENAKNDIVKRAIVGNDIPLTDTEKATACDWLGALKKGTWVSTYNQAYAKSADGKTTYTIDMSSAVVKGAIPLRDGNGQIIVPLVPTEPSHTPSKEYVDTKIGDIETVLDSVIAIQNTLIGGGV